MSVPACIFVRIAEVKIWTEEQAVTENPTIGMVLEQDHRQIDAHFETFAEGLANGRIERAELLAASDALRHHIWVEEELHFPPLRAAGLMGPVLVMLREHGEIWDLLDRIESLLDAESAALTATFGHLKAILDEHNFKEERIVYPAGDEQLDPETMASIRSAFDTGTRPAGWVCQMAGRA